MKVGEEFSVDISDMIVPLIGRVVTLEVSGEPVVARIVSTDGIFVALKVVPETTKG